MRHLRLKDERVKEGKRVVEQWKLTPNQWTSVGVMVMICPIELRGMSVVSRC